MRTERPKRTALRRMITVKAMKEWMESKSPDTYALKLGTEDVYASRLVYRFMRQALPKELSICDADTYTVTYKASGRECSKYENDLWLVRFCLALEKDPRENFTYKECLAVLENVTKATKAGKYSFAM